MACNGPLRAPTPPSAGAGVSDADVAGPPGHAQCALEHPKPVLACALAPPHALPSVLFFKMDFVGGRGVDEGAPMARRPP